ncbi:hypothetical protein [Mucilaginibacter jinjuensis]|uniref:Endosialidase-like protein n=1 Tax=Mucilaginibacter jinjuensis TaxID=1176721 RepID=A0ABY7TAY6_9SPHI|nr:hypothetical protein [Mucilaginibacter jinjuensis]WCT13670.1 hypothetical protein PQO05_06940 [Mucilaginibacter jinjuensis]
MKILLPLILSLLTIQYTLAQNTFGSSGDAAINTVVPSGHYYYNALWMPNGNALMPENSASYSSINLTSNILRNSSNIWGFVNPNLPAWRVCIGSGSATDYFNVSRSASTTYLEKTLFKIDNSGKVGIGTDSPGATLDVSVESSTYTNVIKFGDITPGYLTSGASGIYFSNSSGNPVLVIQHAGNVGIGTSNPDPNSKLTVSGLIHATEILVDANVKIPDYVFDKGYELATLKDVKTYIDQNHHLPDIPSAAQVAKGGINLGEMNTKLLKKIEELTLYLIEKDKQIEALKTQQTEDSQSQQLQIDELKNQIKNISKAK